jgi:hypothetical protein
LLRERSKLPNEDIRSRSPRLHHENTVAREIPPGIQNIQNLKFLYFLWYRSFNVMKLPDSNLPCVLI